MLNYKLDYLGLEKDIFNLIQSMSFNNELGVKEYELVNSLENLNKYRLSDIREGIGELLRSGFISLNYPQNSFIGFYQIKKHD